MTAAEFASKPSRFDNNCTPRLRILVVEKNVDDAGSMAMLLRLHGYRVQVAFDEPAALRAIEQSQPDVVLLDIGLRGLDGWQVARRVRAALTEKKPFLIALTGYSREEDRQRSREAGIDLHLVKPVEFEKLQPHLKRLERIVLPAN